MKKNTFLLFFLCFITLLNAQVESNSKAIVMSIGVENYRQLFSNSQENGPVIGGFAYSKFSDNYARNTLIGIGSRKFLDNDNYQAWSIYGAGSIWERNDVFDIQDDQGNTTDQVSIFAGEVKSYAIGLRYTYGLSLLSRKNINLLIGLRGELQERYYSAPATENVGFDTNANSVSLRTFAVPEIQYLIPNTNYVLSLGFGFPVATIGFDSQNVKNPAFTLRQQQSESFNFNLFRLKENLVELSFGYFLMSK